MKKVIVLSLGGSLIVPEEIDNNFLEKFRKVIKKHESRYKFVIICGGGSIARKYIKALREQGKSEYLQSMAGIAVTRLNARFMTYFFGNQGKSRRFSGPRKSIKDFRGDASSGIPHDMNEVKNLLEKNNIVFCGALRYAEKETSDGTAAKLARFFNCDFINLTLVNGLYTSNPLTHKNAKFIPKISWKKFLLRANKIKYKPGQHFVLDQNAAETISKYKIKTYILGKNLKNLDNLLSRKKFKGTVISG